MCSCYLIFVVLTIIFSEPVMSSWEFAVSTKGQINFYTSEWKLVTSAAHRFDEMTALAFDEAGETLYFNDQIHYNETIFSLKLSSNENHHVERIVKKSKEDEKVQGITFDPLERMLYWTDATSGIIFRMNVSDSSVDAKPDVLIKLNNSKRPHGISIDVCRRQLYWTNANVQNSSIERLSLDDRKHEVVVKKDLHMPRGIVVDQFTRRIFWVDDRFGDHFSIESANLDGSDRRDVVRTLYHVPYDLAVDEYNVYWTDEQDNSIWKIPKNATEDDKLVEVQTLNGDIPKAIIVRSHFLSTQADNPECSAVINKIQSTLATSTPRIPLHQPVPIVESRSRQCSNNGHFDETTQSCKCQREFKGDYCEIPICYNYCIGGTCEIVGDQQAICKCHPGFSGQHCQHDNCHNYCLNDGHCIIKNDEPTCQCPTSYLGSRCERVEINELCTRFCNKEDIDAKNIDLEVVCNNCSKNGSFALGSYYGSNVVQLSSCNESIWNKTAIFVSCSVVISLALVFVIVKTIRHVYKPLRPRIKKTYVVHKNVVPTPLTCRPSTEQCEITIENCCNMNICDTPCFDPKTLQAEANKKDDKKILLNNTDDLLY